MENSPRDAQIETSNSGESSFARTIVAPNEVLSSPSSIAALGNFDTFWEFSVDVRSREDLENSAISSPGSPCSSFCSDLVIVSCCSRDQSNEFLEDSFEFLDPERKCSENLKYNLADFRRENTPTSELRPARKLLKMDHRRSVKMPSRGEIEEFFAEAEKIEQKRFSEKYNFDIVKGTPLEGRYQWIPLKP